LIATTEKNFRFRPRLVIAHDDCDYLVAVYRYFHLLGWEVFHAANGPAARRLAREQAPEAVVLGLDLPGDSGWLSCAKLRLERPRLPILLVADEPTSIDSRCAAFLATSLARRADGPQGLVPHLCDALPTLTDL
jgi:DNA-binding response OmpR family regulator